MDNRFTPLNSSDKERFQKAAWDEMLAIICDEEPLMPSLKIDSSQSLNQLAEHRGVDPTRLSAMIRGDLDWIVLKTLNARRNTIFIAFEVDHTIALLVTTATMASGDTASTISATCFALLLSQRRVRTTFVQVLVHHADDVTTSSRGRFAFNNCHDSALRSPQ